MIRHRTLNGLVGTSGGLYAATSENGILVLRPGPVREILFAVPELNMISPGAVVAHRDMPCFGTYDGSVVCESSEGWKKATIGEFPVTALASDGDRLFAWSGGRLLEVES